MAKLKITNTEIEVNGKLYIEKGVQLSPNYTGDVKIVILQRGWVYIGRFSRNNNDCKLSNAYCIRVWGTSKGLPELVNGPCSYTKLDKCEGTIEFDILAVIYTILVKKDKWSQI